METNKFGVPYHSYILRLKNGKTISFDVGYEDDWGNVQDCFEFNPVEREYVGWGSEEENIEITNVIDCDDETEISDVLDWAKNKIWIYVDKYTQ